MTTQMSTRYAIGQQEVKTFTTQALRDAFLCADIMCADQINLVYTHYDRFIVGGAVPIKQPLTLENLDALKADFFLQRRELGVINVGGAGKVIVDGVEYELAFKEALYVGQGQQQVEFASLDAEQPARFYINSAPAHTAYPTKKVGLFDGNVLEIGSQQTSNERKVHQLLVNGVVETCQLQMGVTCLQPGSVWNTMPAHQHDRRMECYFYFEVPADQAVCHFMGEPQETRHIWVANEQAVVSPPWSIHSGSGTANYSFVWGMAGENLAYDDMDFHQPNELR
ncbi:5-dehydro-4-deoxy-D-glucuronate isomerase (plasmid) [Saccharobesus litoralis]|uniref:4-deoxy-L-threo-5-hexosulose-uronate ketol-isomerase n=1 Tax=Saccharobesus litoralis TaxID=2172099 RepID=A0A2S0VYF0_9ALTE|nr:5-dehydro-4-deoxy-D-glucuronate isomerase [Saccharobesus litoralis]AWB69205.1 5-dehydro-4-deoxy-D-glucuronate isomerase [Saccharobesus litoralis]